MPKKKYKAKKKSCPRCPGKCTRRAKCCRACWKKSVKRKKK